MSQENPIKIGTMGFRQFQYITFWEDGQTEVCPSQNWLIQNPCRDAQKRVRQM